MIGDALFRVLAFDHPLRAVESVGEHMAAGLRMLGIDARAWPTPCAPAPADRV